jgi:hypothetical protein
VRQESITYDPFVRAAVLFVLVACGGGIDRDVERYLTITQGVYGQVVSGSDVAGAEERYAPGVSVRVISDATYGPTVTDAHGFYQIAAPPRSSQICGTVPGQAEWCEQRNVATGARRIDGKIAPLLLWQ